MKLLTSASMKKREQEEIWQTLDTGNKIRKLLTHINVNASETETGYTALLLAVLNGSRDITEMLLFYSADVLANDFKGNTALHLAVFHGRADLVELLLANNADVNSKNNDSITPLHIACQHNIKTQIIFKLVQAGADIWVEDKDKHTPLDIAAMYNRKEAVSLLMGNFPSLATNQCAIVEAAMRDYVDIVEVLLEYGTDPNKVDKLHGTTALHEAVRYCRLKSAEILLAFGSDSERENVKKEKPSIIAQELPTAMKEQFCTLFKEYEGRQPRIPKFLLQKQGNLSESFKAKCLKDYPPLPNQAAWTQNTREFCNSCTENNPNHHILDDNPATFWVIPIMHDAWTVLDLGSLHTITGITITGWNSPQMVKNFEVQSGGSLQGPWSTFSAHTCERLGSTNPRDPGVEQTFKGFTVELRYMRLYVVDNHGGNCICFQGIKLHGADCRISSFLTTCQKHHLVETFIAKGINTYEKLLDMTESDICQFMDDPVEISMLYQLLQEEKRKLHPVSILTWLAVPTNITYCGEELPDFSVQSNPDVTDVVEVEVEGAQVEGLHHVSLQPGGKDEASTAIFHGIRLKPAGKYTIKVKNVASGIELQAPEQIVVFPLEWEPVRSAPPLMRLNIC
ncbi:alpha-latrotoxin-Lhe1a-like isoform X2 [Pomacea canaliculata]|uniref:alpha-latrotoxin-Lhe1a-like isoform X2 n=1 Tax=Pomacea canaliculata TaxID=400727 RepID=UPI000D7263F6|nr:alpha-latrotoxin-Lhe1a-like isoform X2 [Pomacea canaliculata]